MKQILILLSIFYISVNAQTYEEIKVNKIDTKDSSKLWILKPIYILIPNSDTLLTIKNNGSNRFQILSDGSILSKSIARLNNDNIQIGNNDPYSRIQIWNKSLNSVLRLGSWSEDGDPTDVTSEGIVVYTVCPQTGLLDGSNGAYARIKGDRIGLYTASSTGLSNYYFRADTTGLYTRKFNGDKSFEVERYSGKVTAYKYYMYSLSDTSNSTDLQIMPRGWIKNYVSLLLPDSVTYNTSFPFNKLFTYMSHTLTGNDVITINSANSINQGGGKILFINNSTNEPNLTAFHIIGTYDKTSTYSLCIFIKLYGLYLCKIENFD